MNIKSLASRLTKSLYLSLGLLAVLLVLQSARAVDVYWDTNGSTAGAATAGNANGTWNAASTGNWTTNLNGTIATMDYATANGSSPANADVFFSAGTDAISSVNVTLSGAVVAKSITVQELMNITSATTTPSLTLGSGGVTIGSTAVGTTTWISTLPTILSASQPWTNNSSSLFTVNGTVTGAASTAVTLTLSGSGAGGTTLAGVLADGATGGSLVLNVNTASGAVTTLSAQNTFTGGLTLTQGILKTGSGASSNQALGLGTLTLAGGELQLFRPGQTAAAAFGRNTTVTGNAQITSGENSSGAGVTHSLGTLSIGTQTLTIASSSGVISGTSGITFGATTLTGANTSAGGTTFSVSNGGLSATRLTLGALDGTGAFNKTGSGELVLATASPTYSGDAYLKGGTLTVSNNTALGSGTVHLADTAGTAIFNATASGGTRTIANNLVIDGGSSGSQSILATTTGANAGVILSGTITLNENLFLTSNVGATGATTLSGTSITGTGAGFNITNTGEKVLTISGVVGAGINTIIQDNSVSSISLSGTTNAAFTGTFDVRQGSGSLGAGAATNAIVKINSGAFVSNGHGSLAIAGLVDGTGGGGSFYDPTAGTARTLTLGGSGNYSFSGVLGSVATTNLIVLKSGTGTQTLGGASLYTGTTTVSGGTLIAGSDALVSTAGAFGNAASALTLGDAATTTNNSSATLLTGGAYTIARAVTVANQATSGTYSIGGNTNNSSTFSGLITTNKDLTISQVATTGGNALNLTGGITGATAGAKTVTFAGPGAINVSTTGISSGVATVAVNVTGGTTTFSTANTYTGGTTITSGTLLISNSTGSATGTAAVAVNGGTLGGGNAAGTTGFVNGGLVTLASGAHIAPGINAAGTLTLQSGLTLNSTGASVLDFELGSTSDLLKVTGGTFTGNSSNFTTVNIFALTGLAATTYTLIDWTGATMSGVSAGDFALGTVPGGFAGTFSTTANSLQLTVTAVPEPATWALLAFSLTTVIVLRRRAKEL